jgi:hypothetical protein
MRMILSLSFSVYCFHYTVIAGKDSLRKWGVLSAAVFVLFVWHSTEEKEGERD